eukprot:TRINITY_DN7075_c0_g1_i2.p1 TRINITY_DN7075_c0_g1~~TRINITY_DN7075_c0_g1_i2.p1  ORF type:complete len:661 (+),score=207.90 TRINITY_DN7075_c0_g1_i2:81-1985(+)
MQNKSQKPEPEPEPENEQLSNEDQPTTDDQPTNELPKVNVSKKQVKEWRNMVKQGMMTMKEYKIKMGLMAPDEEEEVVPASELYQNGLVGGSVAAADDRSKDIHLEGFTLAYESHVLLKDADLHIIHRRKYGVIGPNGCGKSTLMRHIAERHLPVPANIDILHVEQEIDGSDKTALESVLEADVKRIELLEEHERLTAIAEGDGDGIEEAADELVEIEYQLRKIKAYSAEKRAWGILDGLGFTDRMKTQATNDFSGGWRMRISLARALFLEPDLLLLDEPTNHLDLNACIWLEEYLRKWKKTLIVVSHDRDFLDWIVTDTIEILDQKMFYYKGNITKFLKVKDIRMREYQKKKKKIDKELERLQEKNTDISRKKKAKLKGQKLDRLKEYTVNFKFGEPEPIGEPVIQVKGISFAWPEQENLFTDVQLRVDLDCKVAIVGPNGVGKTTLVNCILGELQPSSGEIVRNRRLRVEKFTQHFVESLDMNLTPVTHMQKKHPELNPGQCRGRLGKFGLAGELHTKPISLLSGGQKSRVVFATISLSNPHLYFLDEPTNHLDIESVEALIDALNEFSQHGGIILISHDQRLCERVCEELWVLRGNEEVEIYEGDFDDYRQEIIDEMDDELFMSSEESEDY